MSERLTKRELKEDRFLGLLSRGLAYARDNVAIVVVVVIVFIGAVTLAVRVGGTAAAGDGVTDPQAQEALAEARFEFQTGRFESGVAALEAVRNDHRKSNAAREATYVAASAYLQNGDFAKARELYEAFVDEPLHGDLMVDGARLGIATCREEQGDLSGALADYQALAGDARTAATRIQAALAGARIAKAQGQPEAARTLYEQVVNTYPNAPEAEDARFGLLQL